MESSDDVPVAVRCLERMSRKQLLYSHYSRLRRRCVDRRNRITVSGQMERRSRDKLLSKYYHVWNSSRRLYSFKRVQSRFATRLSEVADQQLISVRFSKWRRWRKAAPLPPRPMQLGHSAAFAASAVFLKNYESESDDESDGSGVDEASEPELVSAEAILARHAANLAAQSSVSPSPSPSPRRKLQQQQQTSPRYNRGVISANLVDSNDRFPKLRNLRRYLCNESESDDDEFDRQTTSELVERQSQLESIIDDLRQELKTSRDANLETQTELRTVKSNLLILRAENNLRTTPTKTHPTQTDPPPEPPVFELPTKQSAPVKNKPRRSTSLKTSRTSVAEEASTLRQLAKQLEDIKKIKKSPSVPSPRVVKKPHEYEDLSGRLKELKAQRKAATDSGIRSPRTPTSRTVSSRSSTTTTTTTTTATTEAAAPMFPIFMKKPTDNSSVKSELGSSLILVNTPERTNDNSASGFVQLHTPTTKPIKEFITKDNENSTKAIQTRSIATSPISESIGRPPLNPLTASRSEQHETESITNVREQMPMDTPPATKKSTPRPDAVISNVERAQTQKNGPSSPPAPTPKVTFSSTVSAVKKEVPKNIRETIGEPIDSPPIRPPVNNRHKVLPSAGGIMNPRNELSPPASDQAAIDAEQASIDAWRRVEELEDHFVKNARNMTAGEINDTENRIRTARSEAEFADVTLRRLQVSFRAVTASGYRVDRSPDGESSFMSLSESLSPRNDTFEILVTKPSGASLGCKFSAEQDLTLQAVEPGTPAGTFGLSKCVGMKLTHIGSKQVTTCDDVRNISANVPQLLLRFS